MSEPTAPALDATALRDAVRAAGVADHISGAYRAHFIGRFSNDIWRLDLENGPSLIAKQPHRIPRADALPDVERAFYRSVQAHPSAAGALPIPRYVGELDGVLLLEYQPLTGFDFSTGVTGAHAAKAIDALADWHAAWWGRAPEADWLPSLDNPTVLANIQQNYDRAWQEHGAGLLESAPAFQPIGDALVGRLASSLADMAQPATLIHGDAHAENLPLTEYGQILMLDWQNPCVANPGYDLAVFMGMSFRQADRSNHEQQLVERHARRLAAHGCRWPDPWRDYRLGLLYRAARIVELADVGFPSLPWVFRRSALAAVEQDVGALIR